MFTRRELDDDPAYAIELKESLYEQCADIGTEVTVMHLLPERELVVIRFKTAADADKCVSVMHERWFGGRQIQAVIDNGESDVLQAKSQPVRVEEKDEVERLDKFGSWLEAGDENS